MTQRIKNPEPKHDIPSDVKPVATAADTVTLRDKGGKSFVASIRADKQDTLSRRAELLGTVAQLCAELADIGKAQGENSKEADNLSGRITSELYHGQVEGVLTKEIVSDTLGQQFGFTPKKDGSPGKTPAGQGATIRRRLVRAVAAHDFVTNGDGGAFFDGVEPDWTASEEDGGYTVGDVVAMMDDDDITVWTAYDMFQKIKRNNANRTELAFDAGRVSALAEKLGKSIEASAQAFVNDPNLAEAYQDLVDMYRLVDARAAELAGVE